MAAKKGKKRLTRRARQQCREKQELCQARATNYKKHRKRAAVETLQLDDKKLRKKVQVNDTPPFPWLPNDQLSRDKALRYQRLAQETWAKRPGLLDHPYRLGLYLLALVPHSKACADWQPAGRGLTTAFRSLTTKLLGGYSANTNLIDSLLVEHFDQQESALTAQIVKTVISGRKVSALTGTTALPAPLTRRMCHTMINPDHPQTMTRSARRAQVLAYGGSEALARAMGEGQLGTFKSVRLECFWDEVIHWFCRQPDLRPDQVDPLCDYLAHCRQEIRYFSLKGRTLASVNRGMKQWHKELNDLKRFAKKADFQTSGFTSSLWKKSRMISGVKTPYETWGLREIKAPGELVREGSTMHHCVAIYYDAIRSGRSSIWSLKMNSKSRITVEVHNRAKVVVQTRGKFNRLPIAQEQAYIRAWAGKNGLAVNSIGM